MKKERKKGETIRYLKRNYELYLFILPVIIFLFIFHYWPMYGVQIAFRDYTAVGGITGSKWVGLKHYHRFFRSPYFTQTVWNTVRIGFYTLLAGFPVPIIMALLLNHMPMPKFKRFVQTTLYAPNFISTVIVVGMLFIFLSRHGGPVNNIRKALGMDVINFMGIESYFDHFYVWSGVWQSAGFGMIVYLASLSGVSPELHEAATIDGATKIQRILHIDLPTILPTVTILLILNVGSIVSVGFEKAYLMQNPLNIGRSEVVSTYVYKASFIDGNFSFGAAIDLLNNVVNFLLLIVTNFISRQVSETSLW